MLYSSMRYSSVRIHVSRSTQIFTGIGECFIMEADNVMDAPIEAQLTRAQLSPYVRKTARQANEDHPNFSEAQFAEARCKVARTAEVPVESALKVFFRQGPYG